MTIISSIKPLKDSPQIARNQLRALASWEKVADEIIYFNEPESDMESPKVKFFPSSSFPRIKTLAFAAALSPSVACVVNADIVLGEHTLDVIRSVITKGGKAAVSRRYEFEGENVDGAQLIYGDWGFDFFCASRALWWNIARAIPEQYRIGHILWDCYLLGFFNSNVGPYTWDITNRRCVFHPKHEERNRPYLIEQEHTEIMARCGLPRNRL